MFHESALAHQLLDGLKGVEIGAAAHNPFGLDLVFVDKSQDQIYVNEQLRLCGHVAPVDYFADACSLPFGDKTFDFVINSHLIEHIWRPQDAIKEWARVAKKYIYLIVPHKDRTFDSPRDVTSVEEIAAREYKAEYPDGHQSVWRTTDFLNFIYKLCSEWVEIIEVQDVDDKVGNGFAVVLRVKS